MALLPGIGRKLTQAGRGSTLALGGIGLTAGLMHSNLSEKTFDMYSEVMLGDPQVDRALLGTDIGWGTMMGFDPNPVHHIGMPPLQYFNPTIFGDAFSKDAAREAEEALAERNAKYGTNRSTVPNSIYDQQAAVQRRGVAADEDYYGFDFPAPVTRRRRYTTGATGDIVFGMHNMRLG